MPVETTIGRLLLKDAVPPELHPLVDRPLDKRALAELAQALAEHHPDKYRDVMKRVSDVANRAGYEGGGYSFGPEHLSPGPKTDALRRELNAKVRGVLLDPKLRRDPARRDAELVKLATEYADRLEKQTTAEALAAKNPLALQVASGAKGKAENLQSLLAGDVLYTDSNYIPIPYPVTRSFSEGLDPAQYFAATYGARLGISLTKLGTAAGGYACLSKGTLVRLADGSTKPIEDIAVGDVVLGVGLDGYVRPARVTAAMNNGEKEVFRHVFRYGRSRRSTFAVEATDDHRALFNVKQYRYKMRDGVVTGHRQTVRSVLPLVSPAQGHRNDHYSLAATAGFDDAGCHSDHRAFLLGLLLGDGCLTYPGKLSLSSGDHAAVMAASSYFESCGLSVRQRPGRCEYHLTGGVADVRAWLTDLGVWGKTAPHKFLPAVVWTWSNRSVADLVAGIFVTDGSFSVSNQTGRPVARFEMTAGELIRDLRELLAIRFGIHGSPVVTQTAEQMEAVNARMRARPIPKTVRNTKPIQSRHRKHNFCVSNRDHLRRLLELVRTVRHSRVTGFTEAVAAMADSADDLSYCYTWVERVPVGLRPTYDIEIDHPDHFFLLANGAVVSNSKRIQNAAHRQVVTALDAPRDPDTARGLPVDTHDPDNEGALLGAPAGGYPRNTVLSRRVLGDLRRQGVGRLLVRSPAVGGPADDGVYGRDAGVRERGRVAPVGDFVGIAAGQSLGEPISQLIIGCLSRGTLVRMADGSTRPVEGVRVGDRVLGADRDGNAFPVSVTCTFDNGGRECLSASFVDAADRTIVLTATADHRLLAATPDSGLRQLPLGTAGVFDAALAGGGRGTARRVGMTAAGRLPTYDLEVDHPDHLFVLASGLIVSNSKHTGGVAGATGGQQGFQVLDRLISIPSHFPGGATHAQTDGIVTAVSAAPQGGHYVTVDGHEHYADAERKVLARPGDHVEAGDPLTDGVLNPAEVVNHKGVGEGRKRFVEEFMRVARASGFHPHRRNVEHVARGLINHVEVTREFGEHVPGDVVPYTPIEAEYRPRKDARALPAKEAVGQYLEKPVLHYTVGDRVRKSMLPLLSEHGVDDLTVHPEPPPFRPVMVRSHDNLASDPDWMTEMLGSGLRRNLLRSAARGGESDPLGTSFVPGLAEGINFGLKGKTQGF